MRFPCLLYLRSRLRFHPLCLRLQKFFSLKPWNPRLCFGRCGVCLFDCSLFLPEKILQKLQRNHNFWNDGVVWSWTIYWFIPCIALHCPHNINFATYQTPALMFRRDVSKKTPFRIVRLLTKLASHVKAQVRSCPYLFQGWFGVLGPSLDLAVFWTL